MKYRKLSAWVIVATLVLGLLLPFLIPEVNADSLASRTTVSKAGQIVTCYDDGTFLDDRGLATLGSSFRNIRTGLKFEGFEDIHEQDRIDSATLRIYYYTGIDFNTTTEAQLLIEGMLDGAPEFLTWDDVVNGWDSGHLTNYNMSNLNTTGYYDIELDPLIIQEITFATPWRHFATPENGSIVLRTWNVAPVGPGFQRYHYEIPTGEPSLSNLRPTLTITYTPDFFSDGYEIIPGPAGGATNQLLTGAYAGNTATGTTQYNSIVGGSLWANLETDHAQLIASAGTLHTMFVQLNGVAGAGSYNFTVYKNGAPTALMVAIDNITPKANNLVDNVTFTAGDTMSLECDPIGTPNAVPVYWSFLYANTEQNYTNIIGPKAHLDQTLTEYGQLMGSLTVMGLTEDNFRAVIPANGTLKKLYIKLDEDPGVAPDGFNFTVHINDVNSNLTAQVISPDLRGNNTVSEVPVYVGDLISLQVAPLDAPTINTPQAHWSCVFISDVAGESIIIGGSHNDLNDGIIEDNSIVDYEAWTWVAGVPAGRAHIGQNVTIKDLNVKITAEPGIGNSYNFSIYVDGSDTLDLTIASPDTVGDSGDQNATVYDWDLVTIRAKPFSTPLERDAHWGFVVYMPPGGAPGNATWVPALEPDPPIPGFNETCIDRQLRINFGAGPYTEDQVQDAIDYCEDWVPGNSTVPDDLTYAISKKSFKLYYLVIGTASIVIPWLLYAFTSDPEYFGWILVLNALGMGLLIEFMRL